MLIIGLTGPIATGKSTVASILSSPPHNIPIIDTDKIARQIVRPGAPAYNDIVTHFSPLDPDIVLPVRDDEKDGDDDTGKDKGARTLGPLNRAVLGQLVFGPDDVHKSRLELLNRITHPRVRHEVARQLVGHYLRGQWCVVIDVPLLFQGNPSWDLFSGFVLLVGVSDRSIQRHRLMSRDQHLSADDADKRINSQKTFDELRSRTTNRSSDRGAVVLNDGDERELSEKLAVVMDRLRGRHPSWWSWLVLLCPPLALLEAGRSMWRNYWDIQRWNNKPASSRL